MGGEKNFGFYGTGLDGYAHYKQSFDRINNADDVDYDDDDGDNDIDYDYDDDGYDDDEGEAFSAKDWYEHCLRTATEAARDFSDELKDEQEALIEKIEEYEECLSNLQEILCDLEICACDFGNILAQLEPGASPQALSDQLDVCKDKIDAIGASLKFFDLDMAIWKIGLPPCSAAAESDPVRKEWAGANEKLFRLLKERLLMSLANLAAAQDKEVLFASQAEQTAVPVPASPPSQPETPSQPGSNSFCSGCIWGFIIGVIGLLILIYLENQ